MGNGTFSMADTYGRGVKDRQAQEVNQLAIDSGQYEFDEKKRLDNTKWLAAVGKAGLDMDPSQYPQFMSEIEKEGQRRGVWERIGDGTWDYRDPANADKTKEGFQRLYEQGMTGLEAYAGPQDPKLAKDAGGYQRYASGDRFGERAFPDAVAPPPYGGSVQGDLQVINQINREREAKGLPPIDTEKYMYDKQGTSGMRQNYEQYLREGGRMPYDEYSRRFAGDISGGKQLGELGMKKLDDMSTEAGVQMQSINTIAEAAALIHDGIIAGTTAEGRTAIGRGLDTMLGRETDEAALSANTDAYIANAGVLVGKVIRQFGAGTGLSDADREFANRIAGGSIQMTEPALKKILELNYRASTYTIDQYNKRYDRLAEKYDEVSDFYDRKEYKSEEEVFPWLKGGNNVLQYDAQGNRIQ